MTADRVEDTYAKPQLNTGVEGTEEIQRINEGDVRLSNIWMVQRDSYDHCYRMGVAFSCVNQGQGPRTEWHPFSLGSSNDFGSRSQEVDAMPVVRYSPVDFLSDIVNNRRGESHFVVKLHYALVGLKGNFQSRREEVNQRGYGFSSCRDSLLRGTMWLQKVQKLLRTWSKLKLTRRWCWRRSFQM